MAEVEADRRLVKSPPELWAEVSDPATLAKRLGEFGEIRITRVDPETTVAWEGELARGTVEIESSGWGTRVRLTAAVSPPPAPEAVAPPAPDPAPPPDPIVCELHHLGMREQMVELPAPPAEPLPEPEPPPQVGFFGRLLGRRVPEPEPPPPPPPPPPAPEPVVLRIHEVAFSSQLPPRKVPEPPPPPPEPAAPALDDDRALDVLTAVLDDLGAAHHRPFSRG